MDVRSFSLAAVATVLLAGCGHPASKQECEIIMNKVIELELKKQKITDPATLKKRQAETRKALEKTLLKRCLGKRIRSDALSCVQGAPTFDAVNACLR